MVTLCFSYTLSQLATRLTIACEYELTQLKLMKNISCHTHTHLEEPNVSNYEVSTGHRNENRFNTILLLSFFRIIHVKNKQMRVYTTIILLCKLLF